MDAAPKKSLAQLRAEVKDLRKALYKPISRSKKADLEAEIARHKGVTSPSSTKQEAVVPMVEEPKPTKEEKKGKKAEPKKAEKKETKSESKPKKETAEKKKSVKKTEKKD